ncbi:hypothetical protein EET67_13275 [Pseudaminobacter arsenicus]|uniref:Holin n=1 Tax=Borborobacter arsenicus TaxID=1851146 RepID=A0A432V5B0_9HYPH|nr:hypothetical protein [Pseudaminobacter arsenicus]RUM97329.1 hypothetical protein EET67_13275 [Pseudaminobacter arsenicus]
MIANKPWYLSRTIWASLIAVLSAGGSLLGVPVDDADQAALADTVLQAVAALAGILAIIGRVSATSRIG